MRKRGRIDENHKEIVCALRKLGMSVINLSSLGGGTPDLLVGYGINFLLEIKKTEKSKLTPAQENFFENYNGIVFRVSSAEEAIEKMQNELRRFGLL